MGPVEEGEEFPAITPGSADEPLREEDVTLADRLDDRVSEADELPSGDDDASS